MPGTTKTVQPALEHKAAVAAQGAGLLATDDTTGVVEALVSVTGIEDEVKDTIEPGAYAQTLTKRTPKGIFGHDWGRWVAKTLECKELMPGDPALPKTTPSGQPWPAQAGALYVKCQFNLATREGADAYHNVKFFSDAPGGCEWSVGYQVPRGGAVRTKNGGRRIKAPGGMDLYEYSPVLFGAAPLSGTLSVKASGASGKVADNGGTADAIPDDTDDNPSDPVTAEADAYDPDMAAMHEAAMTELDASAKGWDAIDAASAVDPGEEDLTGDTGDTDTGSDSGGSGTKMIVDGGDGQAVTVEFKSGSAKVSDKPWSDFSAADYTPAQYHRACLIHTHGPGVPDDKEHCKLPVREPDGTLNKNGVHAAAGALAGARGGVDASPAQKAKAAASLRGYYLTIGDPPPDSLQAKVLTSADVTGPSPTGPSGPIQLRARLSGEQWTGNAADYTAPQWHNACLIHMHDAGTMPESTDECMLPVADPDGTLSLAGMTAAAGALPVASASDTQNANAAGALRALFFKTGIAAPDELQNKAAAGSPPASAVDTLNDWYDNGAGAANVQWGSDGDFARCVALAGPHMGADKAKGFCQLRHKANTGHFAGHAKPGEGHGGPDRDDDDRAQQATGRKDTGGGYDPALESGPMAGGGDWQDTDLFGDGTQVKDTATATLAGPGAGTFEEIVDAVADALTGQLAGDMVGGVPRYAVTVNGTWPEHAIVTRHDMTGDLDAADSFEVPYQIGDDGRVVFGELTPVQLTVTDDTGTKGLDEPLSPLPMLIEHITGFIRRGLSTKQGRVLSEVNVKLLRGAVDQLISVLNSAGIQIDVPGNDTNDEEQQAGNEGGIDPLYLPDSTAPGAQVNMQKVLLDPGLVSRAYELAAAAHAYDDADGTA